MLHSIRLRGPWEFKALGRWVQEANGEWQLTTEGLPAAGKVEMPGSWESALGAGFSGRVRLTRRFHRPTGLEESSRVWLVVEEVDGEAEVVFNGESLGEIERCPARFDVTTKLKVQNQVEISVTSGQGRAGGLGLVRLEID